MRMDARETKAEPLKSEEDRPPLTKVMYKPDGVLLLHTGIKIHVLKGVDEGKIARLSLQRVRVGSSDDNELQLSDPHVSRRHLEFQVRDDGYLLKDLGSTNGTYYRGARVHEAMLGPGAEVRLGETVLRLEPAGEQSDVIRGRPGFGELLGHSRSMQEVFGILAAVSPTDATVLIEGETGSGKELVAEEIHRNSPRYHRHFCIVDCGALPPNLIESEFFGHERGAFTGAVETREGAFERARGGTVFLDEIGELPLELQTRLLGVLERRVTKRIGSDITRPIDVRVIAATNKDLEQEVRKGTFRRDLYYRLAVIRIILPPLRERRDDILLLARHFLWQAGCSNPDEILDDEVRRILLTRRWPGNIRELRNVVERALLMADGKGKPFQTEVSIAEIVPQESQAVPKSEANAHWLIKALPQGYLERPYKFAKELLINQFEFAYISRLIKRHGFNISRLAGAAGVDRQAIRKLFIKHGINKE